VTFWRYHSRIIGQSVNLFRNNIALLSQIYFPLHLILMEFVAVNVMFFAYSLAGPIVLLLFSGYWPDIYWLWLIPLFLLQTLFSFTIGIYLSIVGTFFRDISGVLFFPLAIWWYISPGMYDVDKVPVDFRWVFDLNPFSYFFTGYHGALLNDLGPNIPALAILLLGSSLALVVGLKLLINARYYFFKYL
jgi:lipopolysaccharide transport system permease protein